jgi:type IV secretion system protein TrbL
MVIGMNMFAETFAHKSILRVLAAATLVMMLSSTAYAATGGVLDNVQDQLVNAAKGWESTLTDGAKSLATIEIGLSAIFLAVAGADIQAWAVELVKRIMFIGFFAFVLANGPQFAKDVTESLWQIGSSSTSGNVSPSMLLDTGLNVNAALTKQIDALGWQAIAQKLYLAGAGWIVLICMSLFAAVLLAVIVEMYVGLMAGIIMLGLGGSSFTKDYPIRYLAYAFSVGMKLMALAIIGGTGSNILLSLASDTTLSTDSSGAAVLAAVAVVMFALAVFVPGIIQGVAQGVSVGSGMEAIKTGQGTTHYTGSAFRAGSAVAGAAIGVGGLAAGAYEAGKLAKNSGASPGQAVAAAFGAGASAFTGGAADKMSGAQGSYGATTLGLANAKLREANAARAKPQNSGSSKA